MYCADNWRPQSYSVWEGEMENFSFQLSEAVMILLVMSPIHQSIKIYA